MSRPARSAERVRVDTTSLDGAPELDTAIARAILQRVDVGELPATLRLARPHRVVAFSGRDAASPGYDAAVAAASAHGFDAVLRLAGGRAAVFTPQTLSFSLAVPVDLPRAAIEARFAGMSNTLARALASLGVDARVGEVPGEYCPGTWSVNARGATKIVGVGQRLLRSAAHTGGVLVVDDVTAIRDVLVDVYTALGLSWDPATVGSVAAEVPGTGWDQVRDAVLAAFAAEHDLEPWTLDDDTLDLARQLAPQHRHDGRVGRAASADRKAVVDPD